MVTLRDRLLSIDVALVCAESAPEHAQQLAVRCLTRPAGAVQHDRDRGVRAHTGLLVPDIPLEETDDIRRIASAAGLELVMLVTPTTPETRMRAIAAVSQGFVYLVSVAGAGT